MYYIYIYVEWTKESPPNNFSYRLTLPSKASNNSTFSFGYISGIGFDKDQYGITSTIIAYCNNNDYVYIVSWFLVEPT